MKKISYLFPGNLGSNVIILILGIISVIIAFLSFTDILISSLLMGVGAPLFLAGFLGIVNLKILSTEISKVISPSIDDLNLMIQIRTSGIEGVKGDRDRMIDKMFYEFKEESQEIVIVGSSLKGLIGVGYDATGRNKKIRELIINALNKGVIINILMTNPEVAHHRSQQEGRDAGGIESEIIKNLMYLTNVRKKLKSKSKNLHVKLYRGTPTIFMISTSNHMIINPYPYYSTAYGSFSFMIRGNSDLYRGYYKSHFQMAWDSGLSEALDTNLTSARNQIEKYIKGKNEHGKDIIPNSDVRQILIEELNILTHHEKGDN